ncbi:MAG: hypothetical protein ABIO44_06130 [Saprospiraceae bacterium]
MHFMNLKGLLKFRSKGNDLILKNYMLIIDAGVESRRIAGVESRRIAGVASRRIAGVRARSDRYIAGG